MQSLRFSSPNTKPFQSARRNLLMSTNHKKHQQTLTVQDTDFHKHLVQITLKKLSDQLMITPLIIPHIFLAHHLKTAYNTCIRKIPGSAIIMAIIVKQFTPVSNKFIALWLE